MDKCNERYSSCPSGGTPLWLVDSWILKEDIAVGRQNTVECVMIFVSKVANANELVMDNCASTSETTKICLQLQISGGFQVGEEYFWCFRYELASLKELYGKNALSPDYNIDGSEEADESS